MMAGLFDTGRVTMPRPDGGPFDEWGRGHVRTALERIQQLLTDPAAFSQRAGADVKAQLLPFLQAATEGDTTALVEGLLASGAGGPLATAGKGAGAIGRSRRRVGTTGQYVGAPPGVDSPQKFAAIVKRYLDAMEAGLAGRDFYVSSSQDALARTGGAKDVADQLVGNYALLSRANNVAGNTSMSAKGHVQAVTGDVVSTGRFPSKDSGPVAALYGPEGASYKGHKRDPFAEQLSVAWAPERVGRGVNDMHEAEIMGFPKGATLGATSHSFMDEVRARAIQLANERKLGGFSDWNTGTAQAAAWSGNKIRRGEVSPGDAAKDYAYYMPRQEVNATYESFPGVGTGHLPNAPANDFAAKLAFHQDPSGTWTNPYGGDILHTAAKLIPGRSVPGLGRFEGEVNPATVARPVAATTKAGAGVSLTDKSQKSLNAIEAVRAYFDAQNAGAWHKVMPSKAPEFSAAGISIPGLNESVMKSLAPQFEAKGFWVASAPEGLTVLRGESPLVGKEFASAVRDILKTNAIPAKPEFGTAVTGFVDYSKEWAGPSGSVAKKMLEVLGQAPETKGLLGASPEVRTAVAARNARDLTAESQGWGAPRNDMMLARQIFANEGWDGIAKAAAKGIIPASAAMALGVGGMLGLDQPMQ